MERRSQAAPAALRASVCTRSARPRRVRPARREYAPQATRRADGTMPRTEDFSKPGLRPQARRLGGKLRGLGSCGERSSAAPRCGAASRSPGLGGFKRRRRASRRDRGCTTRQARPATGDRSRVRSASRRFTRGPASPGTADRRRRAEKLPRKVYRKFDAPRRQEAVRRKAGRSEASIGAQAVCATGRRRPAQRGKLRSVRRPDGRQAGAERTEAAAVQLRSASPRLWWQRRSRLQKAGGPFAKFADGKKPFRKPGPRQEVSRVASPTEAYKPR